MGHDHADKGAHDHAHTPQNFGLAFAIGITLNVAFVVVEAIYGVLSHSMALVADASHNLGDVLGLALAWGAGLLAQRKPTKWRTYGFRGSTIMASLANAILLLVVTGGIAWESFRRLFAPEPVAERTVIVVALFGVAINAGAAALFMRGRKGDINIRSAFLHLASDAVLALGVALAGGDAVHRVALARSGGKHCRFPRHPRWHVATAARLPRPRTRRRARRHRPRRGKDLPRGAPRRPRGP